jgi:hypothetical protein
MNAVCKILHIFEFTSLTGLIHWAKCSDLFKTNILLLFGLFFEGFIILYYVSNKKFELYAASNDL